MVKLGGIVIDKVTGIKGMLTIYMVDMDDNQNYCFQPAGLNPEDMQPLDAFWITEKRVKNPEIVEVNLPLELLGTHVEDKATGFNGTAISLFYYMNGCVHIEVKPKGTIAKTGQSITSKEMDIRRLKGKAIKEMTEKELEKSHIEEPSPEPHSMFLKR